MALAPRILAAAGLLAVPALLAVASQSLARPADIPPVEQQTVVVDLAPAGGTADEGAVAPTTDPTAEPTEDPASPTQDGVPSSPTPSGVPSAAPTTEPSPGTGSVPAPAPAPAPSTAAPAPVPVPAPAEPGLVEREVLDDGFDDGLDDIDDADGVDADVDSDTDTDGDD